VFALLWHDAVVVNFTWIVEVGDYPVLWGDQGDEWIARLDREIEVAIPGGRITGQRYDATNRTLHPNYIDDARN
jgi:hypothetical protein